MQKQLLCMKSEAANIWDKVLLGVYARRQTDGREPRSPCEPRENRQWRMTPAVHDTDSFCRRPCAQSHCEITFHSRNRSADCIASRLRQSYHHTVRGPKAKENEDHCLDKSIYRFRPWRRQRPLGGCEQPALASLPPPAMLQRACAATVRQHTERATSRSHDAEEYQKPARRRCRSNAR